MTHSVKLNNMLNSNTFFLLLNASVICGVVCGLMTWLLRVKAIVILLLLVPFLAAPSLGQIAGMDELIGFYGTSLLYGSPGIIVGMLYADYMRAKSLFQRVSKISFLARGGLAMSAIYLLTYVGSNMLLKNPMVKFVLQFIEGGNQAQKLLSFVDQEGVVIAASGGGFCILVLIGQTVHFN